MFKPQIVVTRDRARRGLVAVFPRRRVKSKSRRLYERARFWIDHGEKIRLVLIGGGMAFLAAVVVTLAIG